MSLDYFFPDSSLSGCCASGKGCVLLCPSCWHGWDLPSLCLSLSLGPETLFLLPCPFRTRGVDAFQLLQMMVNLKLLSQLHELAKYIIHCRGFPHITSDQGTHFTAKEVRQQAYANGIYCSYLARSSQPDRWRDTLLKTYLWHQIGTIVKVQDSILQSVVHTLIQQQTYLAGFPINKMHRSKYLEALAQNVVLMSRRSGCSREDCSQQVPSKSTIMGSPSHETERQRRELLALLGC